jgi:hypothetical protein
MCRYRFTAKRSTVHKKLVTRARCVACFHSDFSYSVHVLFSDYIEFFKCVEYLCRRTFELLRLLF